MRKIDHSLNVGKVFGRLKVLSVCKGAKRSLRYVVKCSCKKETVKEVDVGNLLSGRTTSCGCYRKELKTSHGGCGTKLHDIWRAMLYRCSPGAKGKSTKNYSLRGIRVCEKWQKDFTFFRDWSLTHGYKEGLDLDRRNNDEGYSPENCRFVTRAVNLLNKRCFARSGFKGVYNNNDSDSEWRGLVQYKGKVYRSCGHKTPQAAARARNGLIIKHKIPAPLAEIR